MKTKSILVFLVEIVLASSPIRATMIEKVIYHGLYSHPQYKNEGNILGVAYNPGTQQFYISHGSGSWGGYIHTIDSEGTLINSWEFDATYVQYAWPESISYDSSNNHLFIKTTIQVSSQPITYEYHLLEMSIDGTAIYNDYDITSIGGDGVTVNYNGIWLDTSWENNSITHLTKGGVFVEELFLTGRPGGFSDVISTDLCLSFNDGFFLLDFGKAIIEVDGTGRYIGTTSIIIEGWDGRGLAMDSDIGGKFVFVNDDDYLYVLSGVPEPATLLLLGLGGLFLRRRK